MGKQYRHLSVEDRAVILTGNSGNESMRSMARTLGRSVSTISREFKRNAMPWPVVQQPVRLAFATTMRRRRLQRIACVVGEVDASHACCWDAAVPACLRLPGVQALVAATDCRDTAQDASRRHQQVDQPRDDLCRICAPARRVEERHGRCAQAGQGEPRPAQNHTGQGSDGPSRRCASCIVPEEIEQRLLPGHREGDFIKGSFNRSGVGTVVERKTRFVVLCRMDGCTAADALAGFTRQMIEDFPAFLRESFTYDRGTELTCHVELAKRLKLDIWVWRIRMRQEAAEGNENTNGLLAPVPAQRHSICPALVRCSSDDIARLLNERPRQDAGLENRLAEALAEEVSDFAKRVALDS